MRLTIKSGFIIAAVLSLTLVVGSGLAPKRVVAAQTNGVRYTVTAKNAKAYKRALRAVKKAGAEVVLEMPQINTFATRSTDAEFAAKTRQLKGVTHAGKDNTLQLFRPAMYKELFGTEMKFLGARAEPKTLQVADANIKTKQKPDPGNLVLELMWNLPRVGANAKTWALGSGDPTVTVAVMDTGVDYTHTELARNFSHAKSFYFRDPACFEATGFDDAWVAANIFGGAVKADNDFNGHGSWIGGNIGAVMDRHGINGIAPNVKISSLKISDWCGSAYGSTIAAAMIWAADHDVDVVNLSFGGFGDPFSADGRAEIAMEKAAAKYAWNNGTIIAHSAGNNRARIDANGVFTSHGILAVPGDPTSGGDPSGLVSSPAGDELILVSATNNIVNGVSPSCPADALAAGANTWCKPASDAHHPFGVGKKDQLAYYSNYGPGIDVAAPGGARKFNVPSADRGGTPGWPYTGIGSVFGGTSVADGYNAWEDFSTTSNWIVVAGIDCFHITGLGFRANQCYAIIQGTSMAAPHVAGVMGLIASRNLDARGNPARIEKILKEGATKGLVNYQTELSATDTSGGDRTGGTCPQAYCHFGTVVIPSSEVYGAGLVNGYGSYTATR